MKERISFAQEAKEEIGKKDRTLSEERAFLSALARENGAFRLSKEKITTFVKVKRNQYADIIPNILQIGGACKPHAPTLFM